jgi:integrase
MPRHSQVHFRLKASSVKGKASIYLQFIYKKNRLWYPTSQIINKKDWNAEKQRLKQNNATTNDGKYSLNDLLDNLERECSWAYNTHLKNGIPLPSVIKQHLDSFINQNATIKTGKSLYDLVDRFINGEIKSKGRDKSKATLNNYKAVLLHLREFERVEKYPVDFDTINLDFFYKYTSFLRNKRVGDPKNEFLGGLSTNTIAKDIRILKVFMSEAADLAWTTNYQFKHKKFAITSEDSDAVYLTEQEIISLYRHDFTKTPKLEKIRDLFVFGCFVGLRYSDYSTIKANNIVEIDGEQFIKLITKKTKELVIIPCNPIVSQIFEKYTQSSNKLPAAPSNQKFNDYIKDVCREAALNEVGRLATNAEKPLWECVSSHTARRSMATNYYLAGFPTIDLMKITGHKTEKAFMKYIRITKLDTAKRLSTHIKKNWSAMLLKVAG